MKFKLALSVLTIGSLTWLTSARADENLEMSAYLKKQTQQATDEISTQASTDSKTAPSNVKIVKGKPQTFKVKSDSEHGADPSMKSLDVTISPEFVYTRDESPPPHDKKSAK